VPRLIAWRIENEVKFLGEPVAVCGEKAFIMPLSLWFGKANADIDP
jgi:hypothetical protein